MKHTVITITKDFDGEVENPVGCLELDSFNGKQTACGTRVDDDTFGSIKYTTKERKVGGITCEHCLELINYYKKILL